MSASGLAPISFRLGARAEMKLDNIEMGMLCYIAEHPGDCIAKVIEPFLLQRSESILRARIRGLALRKNIRLQKTRKEVLCYPVEELI